MNQPIKQTELLADYVDKNRLKFNPTLFNKSDDDVITELKNIILSCQRHNKNFIIRVEGFREVDDYNEINSILFNYYENMTRNKNKSKKKENQYAYINLKESDIKLLIVRYYIWAASKSKPEDPNEDYVDVIITVPRLVDKYYFRIAGVMYSALYQIVDGSTYNNATVNSKNPSVTLKIVFMATRCYREFVIMKSTKDDEVKIISYRTRIFNKSIAGMKYFMAKFGYYGGINFLGIRDVFVSKEDPNNDMLYTFKRSSGEYDPIFISVPKMLMDTDTMTQSFVYMLYNSIVPGMDFNLIFTNEFWIRSLGGDFNNTTHEKMLSVLNPSDNTIPDTYDKGISVLDSFESIYDISTHNDIRLPEHEKADMYCILRWMMREFNMLRQKDNLDIGIKKIRYAGYLASLYAMKIAKGIYRVADANRKATVAGIKKAIVTPPNFLLRAIMKCSLVTYRNTVNDMDAISALKFTYKGVSGLGESSNNSIPDIYRTVQPSHIGRLDLDSSSNSDPGVTGTISPFAPVYDGFFSDYEEPHEWEDEFASLVREYQKTCKLNEVFDFKEKVLGANVSEERAENSEVKASLEQIINPIQFKNMGPVLSLEDLFRGGLF